MKFLSLLLPKYDPRISSNRLFLSNLCFQSYGSLGEQFLLFCLKILECTPTRHRKCNIFADSIWFFSRYAAIGKRPLILRMKRLGCILCMPHKWTCDSKYSCRRTKIKIFAPPVAWFSLSAKLFSPLSSLLSPSTVPRKKSCSGRFYPMWLDNSIVRKYIY